MSRYKFDQVSWPKGVILNWSGKRTRQSKDYPAYAGQPGKGSLAGWAIADGAWYGDTKAPDLTDQIKSFKEKSVVVFESAPIVKL